MTNNLDLSPDGQLNFSLAALRGLEHVGQAENHRHLVPGIFFSLDPESQNRVDVECHPVDLMTIRIGVDQPGRWLTLNMGVGGADISGCKIIGFACKSDAPVTATCKVSLRSGIDGGHHDAFFAKTLVSYPKTSLHLDVLELDANPDIPARAPWRELVIFFEPVSQEIVLRDFRLIMI